MLCKFYLWRKPGDKDYQSPKIQLVSKDIFKEVKVRKIIEVITVKKAILVQYLDSNEDIQVEAVYLDG